MKLIVIDAERCVGCQSCMFACARRHHEAGLAKSCIVVHSSDGMERGFKIVVCRACEDPPCPKVCPTGVLRPAKRGGCFWGASEGREYCLRAAERFLVQIRTDANKGFMSVFPFLKRLWPATTIIYLGKYIRTSVQSHGQVSPENLRGAQ